MRMGAVLRFMEMVMSVLLPCMSMTMSVPMSVLMAMG